MKIIKRELKKKEIVPVVNAIWNALELWDRVGVTKKAIRERVEDAVSISIENAETKEPLFILLGCTEMQAAQGDGEHQELFEWKDGKLQRFDYYNR